MEIILSYFDQILSIFSMDKTLRNPSVHQILSFNNRVFEK
uniref:Uncharacterized protein n=1 Tax=Arundo donax TaxID=35708 RepID=A0A0A9GN14_ARUDO